MNIVQIARRFRGDQDGQVAVVFALALVPLLTGIGAAVDYSRANNSRTALQTALDASVLAGAKDQTPNWVTVATNVFSANLAPKGASVASPSFKLVNAKYQGDVTATIKTMFLGLVGVQSMTIGAHATAVGNVAYPGACLIALDKKNSASHQGLVFNGAPNVNMAGCAIRSNTSLNCNGHSGGALASIAVGTASGCSNSHSGTAPLKDIYAPLASNISIACNGATPGGTWSPGSPPPPASMKTVSKGSYTEYHVCGDLTLSGTGDLFGASPGADSVIIIENGSLTMANDAAVNTARTTIVLAGNNSKPSAINFPNGTGKAASLSLSPSTSSSNPWQGVSLYQDPALTNGIDDDWGPGATFNADGVVYLPNANVTTQGNSASGNSKCTVLVTNTFTTNGSLNLNFSQTTSGCTSLGVKQDQATTARLTQ